MNKIYLLRIFIWILFLAVILFTFPACKQQKPQLPNVVIIFMDDMGYADLSCFGASNYQTPHIDKLSEEGAIFTNFYASQAVCSASRGSLLTGCYSERIGIKGALNAYSNIGINSGETTMLKC